MGGSHILGADERNQSREEQITVTTVTLDGLDQETKNVVLVKLGVAGHELEVLRGGEKLIKSCTPIIPFEQGKREFRDGTSPVVSYLDGCG